MRQNVARHTVHSVRVALTTCRAANVFGQARQRSLERGVEQGRPVGGATVRVGNLGQHMRPQLA